MEDTQWNDILREKGIITEQQVIDVIEDVVQNQNKDDADNLSDKDLSELDELEDDLDDRILEEYRRKRIAEMQAMAKAKFGEIRPISKPDYPREVTEASNETPVVVFLHKPGMLECELLETKLKQVATMFPNTKFVSIIGNHCIPNYPDRNLPTLIVYVNGDVTDQVVTLNNLGGTSVSIDTLKQFLVRAQAIPEDLNHRKASVDEYDEDEDDD